jgi:hypothetical protein
VSDGKLTNAKAADAEALAVNTDAAARFAEKADTPKYAPLYQRLLDLRNKSEKGFCASQMSFYAVTWAEIRVVGREHGYALALHGSLQRDLDVVAVPWTEDASDEETLVNAITEVVGGFVSPMHEMVEKPHGRRVWVISWGGASELGSSERATYIDLSIMPRSRDLQAGVISDRMKVKLIEDRHAQWGPSVVPESLKALFAEDSQAGRDFRVMVEDRRVTDLSASYWSDTARKAEETLASFSSALKKSDEVGVDVYVQFKAGEALFNENCQLKQWLSDLVEAALPLKTEIENIAVAASEAVQSEADNVYYCTVCHRGITGNEGHRETCLGHAALSATRLLARLNEAVSTARAAINKHKAEEPDTKLSRCVVHNMIHSGHNCPICTHV